MRRFFNIAAGLLFFSALAAQDVPFVHSVDQYLNNGLIINPAYAGSREALSATLMHRSQWLGFEGAPVSEILAAHTPLKNDQIGLGIMFDNFKTPATQYNSLYFNYAYSWEPKNVSGRLSMGLKAGGYLYSLKLSALSGELRDQNDIAFTDKSGFAPNFGAGVYYYNTKFFAGLSVPFLMSNSDSSKIAFDPGTYHYVFTAGCLLFGENKNFKIKPVTLIDYNKFNISYQFATHFILLDDLLWLGAAYKSNKDLTFMLEIQLNPMFKFGYAFDYSFSDIAKFSYGSHELMIRWEWKNKANVDNPFYF